MVKFSRKSDYIGIWPVPTPVAGVLEANRASAILRNGELERVGQSGSEGRRIGYDCDGVVGTDGRPRSESIHLI